MPGVSVGHNERGAWGFTIFPIDQEDLYVYETDPADPVPLSVSRRLGGDEDDPRDDRGQGTAPVAGRPEVHPARAGRLRRPAASPGLCLAGRLARGGDGTLPGEPAARPGRELGRVPRGVPLFPDCPRRTWSGPIVDGHIGWQAVGLAPRRKNWDGLLPVPGDGRYEWDGFLPILDLPHVADPPRGWFASANQDNLPPGYPFAVGFQWTDPFRFARIEEVLGSGRRFTLMDMMQLQQDEASLPARSLVPLLRGLKPARRSTRPRRSTSSCRGTSS